VSYQSRVKKRRYKAATKKAKRNRTSETARRWFLTLASKPGLCGACPARFDRGAEIVYRHEPREIRCVRCGERAPDSKGCRPSLRWEAMQRQQRKGARAA
jgi:hypothetical protein